MLAFNNISILNLNTIFQLHI